jgi:hypothetical protein
LLQLPFFTGAITRATAQCARLIKFDNRACGGVVHEVDKLLVPPTDSILQLIEKGENYTLLRKVIEVSNAIQWYNQNSSTSIIILSMKNLIPILL